MTQPPNNPTPAPTEPGTPLRVAIWCAVSSKPQAGPDKISLDAQEEQGRQFAQAIGGIVVSTYIIRGASRDLVFWKDPERSDDPYRQLRKDVEANTFNILHAGE